MFVKHTYLILFAYVVLQLHLLAGRLELVSSPRNMADVETETETQNSHQEAEDEQQMDVDQENPQQDKYDHCYLVQLYVFSNWGKNIFAMSYFLVSFKPCNG